MNVKNSKLLHALAPVLAISIVLTTGVIATNTSAAAASIKLPTPAHLAATPVSATAISVTFDSVDHASSYTVKVPALLQKRSLDRYIRISFQVARSMA